MLKKLVPLMKLAIVVWLTLLPGLHSSAYAAGDSPAPLSLSVVVQQATSETTRCTVLLHGLARSADSMSKLSVALNDAGWHTANVDYPSRKHPIETLAPVAVAQGVGACRALGAKQIDAVTHSLGGILMRHSLKNESIEEFGRLVMLGPPNHGSEIVDALGDVPGYEAFNGPAGLQIGTGESSLPNALGPIQVDAAVIAGTASINLLLSTFLPNPDDGKVSVASARLEGMCAMLTVDVSHPFLMKNERVIEQVIAYLSSGKFKASDGDEPEYPSCDSNRR